MIGRNQLHAVTKTLNILSPIYTKALYLECHFREHSEHKRVIVGISAGYTESCNVGTAPCCEKTGLKKKDPWTLEEDNILVNYIQKNGHGSWCALRELAAM